MTGALLTNWEGHDADYWCQSWSAAAVHLFDVTTSTNDVAAQLAADGAPHLSIVVAEEQTHGRGRGGAPWLAERGASLLFSVLLRIDEQGPAPGCAPVRVGHAVAAAISRAAGTDAGIKWPNDVVFAGHGKVAGVLCEGTFGQQAAGYVIVGVGINVSQSASAFTGDLLGKACSIRSATGVQAERSTLVADIVAQLRAFDRRITQPLTDNELERLAGFDLLNGRRIICELGDGRTLAGVARGVARDGALRLELAAGLMQVYNATVRLADAHAYPGSSRG